MKTAILWLTGILMFSVASAHAEMTVPFSGPSDPVLRALSLQANAERTEEQTAEMNRLFSDNQVIILAKRDWLARGRTGADTEFLIHALQWRENPHRMTVVSVITELLAQPADLTELQKFQEKELVLSFMEAAPAEFKIARAQIPEELIRCTPAPRNGIAMANFRCSK